MTRTKSWTTKEYCDIQIRKNRVGPWNLYGCYYPRSSVVGLRFSKYSQTLYINEIVETKILKTLLHEINHWATYLFMGRMDWRVVGRAWRGIEHDERLIEKIANWPLIGGTDK